MPAFDLPYFDQIIDGIERDPASALARAFERHVHWGYYAEPEGAGDSVAGYLEAAQEMTRRVCLAAGVADGLRILDVGCGFGGTIAYLNSLVSGCELVGLNIDPRQLEKARDQVEPRAGNTVRFVEGDACAMPFDAGRFDVVLAIECIFHFRSRKAFFREARRVASPASRLVISDFLRVEGATARFGEWSRSNPPPAVAFYGSNSVPLTPAAYQRLAKNTGFDTLSDDDITRHTLPTYPAMRRLYDDAGLPNGAESTDYLEQIALQRFVGYHLLTFAPPDESRE